MILSTRPLVLAALVLVAALSGAQSTVNYAIATQVGDDAFDDGWSGAVAGEPLQHAIDAPGLGYASAYADGTFGVNRASATLRNALSDAPVDYAYAGALSYTQDWFTISDPTLDGTSGSFTTTLYVHGTGDVSVSDAYLNGDYNAFDALWQAQILVQADGVGVTQTAYFEGRWQKVFSYPGLEVTGDPLNAYQAEFEFSFVYGQPIYLENSLLASVEVDNRDGTVGTYDATLDLGHSAYWAGLRNVKDADGNVLTSYGYSSVSGYDYRRNAAPVPEPASLLALATGLAMLRRRRKVRTPLP